MLEIMPKQKITIRATKEDLEYAKKMGARIRNIRKRKEPKMSIEKLAELSGLSAMTVGEVERGNIPLVSFAIIRRIAAALNVPVKALTSQTDLALFMEVSEDISNWQ